jgi:hypothetical protein
MLGRIEEARFLRERAAELRRIANFSTFLAPLLLRLAQELEDRAGQYENEADGVAGSGT